MLLINQNDASIPTYFFLFLSNFRGLMRNPGEDRSPIKAKERAQSAGTSEDTSAVFLLCSGTDAIMGKY